MDVYLTLKVKVRALKAHKKSNQDCFLGFSCFKESTASVAICMFNVDIPKLS